MNFKKLIIIFILISILSILITVIAIVSHNYKRKVETELRNASNINSSNSNHASTEIGEEVPLYLTYHRNIKDNASSISKNLYYDTNSLLWDLRKYEDNKSIIYYYQIDGLIDKNVQTEINDKLKSSAVRFNQKLQDAYSNRKDDDVFEITKLINNKYFSTQKISASFGNVISVCNCVADFGNISFCNIDLNTGKDLKFEELFTSNADIKQIVSSTFIKKLGDYNTIEYNDGSIVYYDGVGEVTEYGDAFFKEVDTRTLERAIKRFFSTYKIEFGFTDSQIILLFNLTNESNGLIDNLDNFYIKYEGNEKNIAIFSRFNSSKSIFENDKYATKRIKALENLGVCDYVKESKLLVEDNGVILNYIIRVNSDYCSLQEKQVLEEELVRKLKEKIESDVSAIRTSNITNNVILFQGCFTINIFKSNYSTYDEEKLKILSDFIEKDKIYATCSYCPEVFSISRKDANTLLHSNMVKYEYYNEVSYDANFCIITQYFSNDTIDNLYDKENIYIPYYNDISFELSLNSDGYINKEDYIKCFIRDVNGAKEIECQELLKYLLKDRNKFNDFINRIYDYEISKLKVDNWHDEYNDFLIQNTNKNNFEIKMIPNAYGFDVFYKTNDQDMYINDIFYTFDTSYVPYALNGMF